MRFLITSIIAVGVVAIHAFDNPALFARLLTRVSATTQSVLQDKQVRIDGLEILSRSEVERLLPLGRSVGWWQANNTEIQAAVQRSPWVARAQVTRCSDSLVTRWGCFVVSVKERVPTFVSNVDGTAWIIDEEGSFIVPQSEFENRKNQKPLVIVRGLASRAKSPDLVRAQLSAAAGLLPVLEKQVGRKIVGVELLGQGDFGVMFKGIPFPTVFAGGKDATVPLSDQGERCAALLRHLLGRFHEVKKVDLAFSRVGVVTFITESPPSNP